MANLSPFSLDGSWNLYFFQEGSFDCPGPSSLKNLGLAHISAQVPGNVELDLQRAGIIDDPFFGRNIHLLRQYEGYEWWYVRSFTLPAAPAAVNWDLVFDGLDLLAQVWLNDHPVGRSANMLVPQRFAIGPELVWGGENEIAVRLSSPLNHARRLKYEPQQMSWEQRWEGLWLRKAPHVWGWDIMPRAVSAGIWRSVYLEPVFADGFDWIYYWTRSVDAQSAHLGVRFQVRTAGALDGLRLHFSAACRDQTVEFDWPLEFIAGGCDIPIPHPYCWWPKGYGNPDCYTLTARLFRGDTLLAERQDQVGLRTLAVKLTPTAGLPDEREALPFSPSRWDREPDPNHHFVITVNGVPIMVKGTNWVPLDAFHSRDAGRLPAALRLAEEAGCNMIRCWGGNVYESDDFFAFCDTHGILVWQDLAFACCAYPQDEQFRRDVETEIEKIALRLRNHACLAVWCGDNENDMLYLTENLDPAQNRLTRETIPQVLQRVDPHRSFLPSSPYASPQAVKERGATPEQHLWGPRGYFKSPFYTRHSAHFIGEIGYHGCPDPLSLRKFLAPDDLWPWQNNPAWQDHSVYHWRNSAVERDRIRLMANQIRELFGEIPDDLSRFALASQITQAEAKKFFIESTRLRKWATSGIIWWNLIDGWPQFSDAVVDYYFTPKLAYHYIQRAQAPVALIVGEPGAGKYLPLVACNDTLEDGSISFRAWDAGSGEMLAQGEARVPSNQNWQLAAIRTFASDQRLILLGWQIGGQSFGSHYITGAPPFSLETYIGWLKQITALPNPFDIPLLSRIDRGL